ncbi:MAG: DUF881 domain-containing protein [Peptostreptococcaceae bacterium]
MHKKISYKSLVIVTIILGIFISLQLKSINIENEGMTTIKKGEQLKEELKAVKNEEQQLQQQIEDMENKIEDYKGSEEGTKVNSLKSEIKRYEELVGFTDVKGEGIKVIIESNDKDRNDGDAYSINYNYDLLLSIINKLNSAQANSISINNQRIMYNSYMHLKGDELYLNDIPITEPFVIEAIGNADTLSSALQIKYGIIWEIESYYNAKVTVEKESDLIIRGSSLKKYLEGVDSIENSEDDEI